MCACETEGARERNREREGEKRGDKRPLPFVAFECSPLYSQLLGLAPICPVCVCVCI